MRLATYLMAAIVSLLSVTANARSEGPCAEEADVSAHSDFQSNSTAAVDWRSVRTERIYYSGLMMRNRHHYRVTLTYNNKRSRQTRYAHYRVDLYQDCGVGEVTKNF